MLFAVRRTFGPAYDRGTSLDDQPGWEGHARFMDDLAAEAFVLVGGPLGEEGVLLVVAAADEAEVRASLAEDPWGEDMLALAEVSPWQVRLRTPGIAGPDG